MNKLHLSEEVQNDLLEIKTYIEEELLKSKKAIQILGGRVEDVVKFSLPETDIHRSFVKIRKTSATKNKYPRKAGLPAKEPLS